ncbi:MAG: carboxypeptidase regulatory-like domain-containing protein [Gracilimonas sp.]|nr:carboxypeptidase regulatory-like domain-containing protein [Gracilimonas sp.]
MIPKIETYRSVFSGIRLNALYFCTLVFLSSVCSIQVSAQDALIRTVVISTEDGSPMVGANVLIYTVDDESELLYNCVSNPTGFCEIRGITPETEFELRISYVGFSAHAERFVLEPGERRTIRVELETEVGALQDEAVVTGDRVVTTGGAGVQRVSSDDIARIPTPGVDGDLVSFLQTEPGIVTTGDRGGDLFIRGGTPDQNLVLVDNLPVVKPFHVSNLFSAFSEEVIQNADIYAGGYGAEFSNAMSAVIDISLRPGNLRKYAGSGAVSPYMVSFHAEGPIVRDRQSFLVMGRELTD